MNRVQIERVIALLEDVRRRQNMFIMPVDVEAAVNFLAGFRTALRAFEWEIPHDAWARAHKSHGWEYTARGVWQDMRAAGLGEEAIVDRLLDLEIAAWKLLCGEMTEHPLSPGEVA